MELTGKLALVTGASQGIGRATALALLQEGAQVVICARNSGQLDTTVQELEQETGQRSIYGMSADVCNAASIAELFKRIKRELGSIDILVNNAGQAVRSEFLSAKRNLWEESYRLNVLGAVECAQHALPHMLEQRWGRIVNVAAIAGREPVVPGSVSNTTKGAVLAFSKSLANEFGRHGVLTNCIVPGRVLTPQTERLYPDTEAMLQYADKTIPLGRFGEAREVGEVIAFLCTSRASYINGVTLNVDGGMVKSIL